MSDIANAAEVSRAALYLSFKNKEDIFAAVFLHWIEESILAVREAMATVRSPMVKLQRAFYVWVVGPFDMVQKSPDAKDLIECSLAVAQSSLRKGYEKFEAEITPVLASLHVGQAATPGVAPERIAHLLTSAARGFQQAANTVAELRNLIAEVLAITCGERTANPRAAHLDLDSPTK